jgi:hypothetical protein
MLYDKEICSSKITNYVIYLLLIFLVFFVILTFSFFSERQPIISDSIGYVYAGQNFASRSTLTHEDDYNKEIASFFYPHSFRRTIKHTDTPFFGYPPGMPLLLAFFIRLTGNNDSFYYFVPVVAGLSVLATYYLAYLISDDVWVGLWATLLLAGISLFWTFGTSTWSEMPSLLLITGGICLFLISENRGRYWWGWTFLGGVLIGFSFFVRFTNAFLVIPALILYILYTRRTEIFRDKAVYLFLGTISLFCLGVLLFNHINYGGALASIYNTPYLGAYSWPMFSLKYALGSSPVSEHSFLSVLNNLWQNLSWFLLLLFVGWWGMKRSFIILTGGVILATVGLYSVYAFRAEGLNARFLLPAYPFIVSTISLGLMVVNSKVSFRHSQWVVTALLIVWLVVPISQRVDDLEKRNEDNYKIVAYAEGISGSLTLDAVFVSSYLNDILIIYEGRSVLNYRRMLQADEINGGFDYARFQSCLVNSIDQLLKRKVPVYFVEEDGWGIKDVLSQHYDLVRGLDGFPVYELVMPQDTVKYDNRVKLGICDWMAQ